MKFNVWDLNTLNGINARLDIAKEKNGNTRAQHWKLSKIKQTMKITRKKEYSIS